MALIGFMALRVSMAQAGFVTAPALPAGLYPESMAVGDFNNDGIPDLAVANFTSENTVTILLGNGDGTFQPAKVFSVGTIPVYIAVGDFNGDGNLDIVLANFVEGGHYVIKANDVRVFLGNGDGTFKPAGVYNTGLGPRSVAVGDFNGDGILDLAVLNGGAIPQADGAVSILLGNGDGTFQVGPSFAVGELAYPVETADFNGDGILDLVVANSVSGTVSVLLGNGDGTFQAAKNYPASYASGFALPFSLAVGDLNGDGIPDLVVTANADTSTHGSVSIFLGNGDGTFQAPFGFPVSSPSYSVALADFNGDGTLDIAVTNFAESTVSVFLGNGDGTFQAALSFAATTSPSCMAVADFNGDGYPDLVVGESAFRSPGATILLLNDGVWP